MPVEDLRLKPIDLTRQRPQLSGDAMEGGTRVCGKPVLLFVQRLQGSRYAARAQTRHDSIFS